MSDEVLKDQDEMEGLANAADGSAETIVAEPSLEEQLEAARAEAARNLDGYLRAQAEVANVRKRFEKQRAQALSHTTADIVAKLLPALDDFSRAIDNVPEAVAADSWYSGMELVHRKLNAILENFNVKPIEAVGQLFDPNIHEAISQEPSDEHASGVVTRELVKGYQIGDRIIRPALVYVAE